MDEEIIFSLLEQKNFKELKPILAEMNGADVAQVLADVSETDLPIVFRLLPKDLAAETFVEMDSDMQESLVRRFSDKELKQIVEELYVDDAVDLIEEMPASLVRRILQQADPETRKEINAILQYPDDSAGSIMTTEYVCLNEQMTVEESFARIRATGVDKETIYTCYVIDECRRLKGLVTVKDLLLHSYETKIEDIMETNVIYIETHADREDAARMFDKYSFLAMPVVDKEVRLVGIITIDDAMDVLTEEASEDITKISAISSKAAEKPYFKQTTWDIYRSRIIWLAILMLSSTFSGMVITANERTLTYSAYATLLTACIPMITGTGGNSGSQASVSVIRGIALGEIEFKDIFKVMWKEFRASLLIGLTLGIICFLKLILVNGILTVDYGAGNSSGVLVGLTICGTVALTVVISKIIGCILPLLAKKCKLDPAVVASPFISTIIDTVSLLIYCGLSMLILANV